MPRQANIVAGTQSGDFFCAFGFGGVYRPGLGGGAAFAFFFDRAIGTDTSEHAHANSVRVAGEARVTVGACAWS